MLDFMRIQKPFRFRNNQWAMICKVAHEVPEEQWILVIVARETVNLQEFGEFSQKAKILA